jgi:hypothetical protein
MSGREPIPGTGKKPPVSIGQEAGWAPESSGRCGEETNLWPLTGVAVPTEPCGRAKPNFRHVFMEWCLIN